jgi:hypothetical protein
MHGNLPRGLIRKTDALAPVKWNGQGRFDRLFDAKKVPPAQFDEALLEKLATHMVGEPDAPKDGPDTEESGIPALYTYFGQFVDHDLSFDPETSFQKKKDANADVDFRTPAFDLDSVYGRGPGDQPYMYAADRKSFELGEPLTLGAKGARDLLRSPAGRALIGDPRNDENAIVSQFHGLVLRFHNRLVRENHPFEEAQATVRRHYQYVVVNDFLPRIVSEGVLNTLRSGGRYDRTALKLFPLDGPFMPYEFSGACYRFGHSMVRPGYRLNDGVIRPIFPGSTAKGPVTSADGLAGGRPMISDWGIDWGRFIDCEPRRDDGTPVDAFTRLQFAYRIDTSLADPLARLPEGVVPNPPPSLAYRNLKRGNDLGLPSGQAVANFLKGLGLVDKPLDDEEIIIAGKGGGRILKIHESFKAFAGNCPLWTYVLAEAMRNAAQVEVPILLEDGRAGKKTIETPRLGPVGGRIVAEVILGLMFVDPLSILNEGWEPDQGPGYKLKDFVADALR